MLNITRSFDRLRRALGARGQFEENFNLDYTIVPVIDVGKPDLPADNLIASGTIAGVLGAETEIARINIAVEGLYEFTSFVSISANAPVGAAIGNYTRMIAVRGSTNPFAIYINFANFAAAAVGQVNQSITPFRAYLLAGDFVQFTAVLPTAGINVQGQISAYLLEAAQ